MKLFNLLWFEKVVSRQNSHQRCFVLTLFIKISQYSQGKHRFWSLFLIRLQMVFSCEYCEIFKNTYSEEHLPKAASIHTYISNLKIILLIVKVQLLIRMDALLVNVFRWRRNMCRNVNRILVNNYFGTFCKNSRRKLFYTPSSIKSFVM